ncbi:uncharacterized protein VTP21DRAFT_5236 [Calcarisporiella thermophila]|uniref:uncharacterized protein n=1 Tax=Calcarisporiella thermophila TaxID=911321 RepID=UPI0037433D93
MASSAIPDPILKAGFLLRPTHSLIPPLHRRRFHILTPTSLYTLKSPVEMPYECIDLTYYAAVEPAPLAHSKRSYSFRLEPRDNHTHPSYEFSADTWEEMEDWMRAIFPCLGSRNIIDVVLDRMQLSSPPLTPVGSPVLSGSSERSLRSRRSNSSLSSHTSSTASAEQGAEKPFSRPTGKYPGGAGGMRIASFGTRRNVWLPPLHRVGDDSVPAPRRSMDPPHTAKEVALASPSLSAMASTSAAPNVDKYSSSSPSSSSSSSITATTTKRQRRRSLASLLSVPSLSKYIL